MRLGKEQATGYVEDTGRHEDTRIPEIAGREVAGRENTGHENTGSREDAGSRQSAVSAADTWAGPLPAELNAADASLTAS